MDKKLCNQRILLNYADEVLEFKNIGSRTKQDNTDYVKNIAHY